MREHFYIQRNGELEHVWKFRISAHGFDTYVFVRGTETEAREYINSEYPHDKGGHIACGDKELEAIAALGLTVYIAPRL